MDHFFIFAIVVQVKGGPVPTRVFANKKYIYFDSRLREGRHATPVLMNIGEKIRVAGTAIVRLFVLVGLSFDGNGEFHIVGVVSNLDSRQTDDLCVLTPKDICPATVFVGRDEHMELHISGTPHTVHARAEVFARADCVILGKSVAEAVSPLGEVASAVGGTTRRGRKSRCNIMVREC